MPARRLLCVLALTAAAAAAGACGDERSAQEVARTYVAGDDPDKCADAELAFLERQTGARGEAARAACERNVERSRPPQEVRVVAERVRGERAEVQLEADTQDVRVSLVRRDGDWLVTDLGGG